MVAARVAAEALPGFPGALPDSLDGAYAIQTASIARWGDAVGGWKIGMIPADDQLRADDERLAGPIFKSSIVGIESGGTRTMPIYAGGFAAVEAEFILELGCAVQPSAKEYSNADLAALVSSLFVGAEIASSPMAAINELGPAGVISDFGNNAGLLLGPAVANWRSGNLDSLTAKVMIDGAVAGAAAANAVPGGPLAALRFLLGLAARRDIELPEGTLISTGAVTGIHGVSVSSAARVDFGSFGWFDVKFKPKRQSGSMPN
ncbi:MAG: 2-keto-4-pentenoate hydratase [Gammaproteobacteria bacterium]|nr:2-keto-4-pentenoate hydratase [Gammaproteobacteria bacterium]